MSEARSADNIFERELDDLISRHGVAKFLAVFNDPDRGPNALTRMIVPSSTAGWSVEAIMVLGERVQELITDGTLRPRNQADTPKTGGEQ